MPPLAPPKCNPVYIYIYIYIYIFDIEYIIIAVYVSLCSYFTYVRLVDHPMHVPYIFHGQILSENLH